MTSSDIGFFLLREKDGRQVLVHGFGADCHLMDFVASRPGSSMQVESFFNAVLRSGISNMMCTSMFQDEVEGQHRFGPLSMMPVLPEQEQEGRPRPMALGTA